MKSEAISNQCQKVLEKRTHALIGISPFNSYFSEDRIYRLAKWAKEYFSSYHLFVPDKPTEFTLRAQGYSEKKAVRKARRQGNYLKNKIDRALSRVDEEKREERVIDWNWLKDNKVYNYTLNRYRELFEKEEWFRQGCLSCTKWVLGDGRRKNGEPDHEALRMGVNYLLCEMPLFINSTDILDKKSSVFCYHRIPNFLEKLFQKRPSSLLDSKQGFVVLKDHHPN